MDLGWKKVRQTIECKSAVVRYDGVLANLQPRRVQVLDVRRRETAKPIHSVPRVNELPRAGVVREKGTRVAGVPGLPRCEVAALCLGHVVEGILVRPGPIRCVCIMFSSI